MTGHEVSFTWGTRGLTARAAFVQLLGTVSRPMRWRLHYSENLPGYLMFFRPVLKPPPFVLPPGFKAPAEP